MLINVQEVAHISNDESRRRKYEESDKKKEEPRERKKSYVLKHFDKFFNPREKSRDREPERACRRDCRGIQEPSLSTMKKRPEEAPPVISETKEAQTEQDEKCKEEKKKLEEDLRRIAEEMQEKKIDAKEVEEEKSEPNCKKFPEDDLCSAKLTELINNSIKEAVQSIVKETTRQEDEPSPVKKKKSDECEGTQKEGNENKSKKPSLLSDKTFDSHFLGKRRRSRSRSTTEKLSGRKMIDDIQDKSIARPYSKKMPKIICLPPATPKVDPKKRSKKSKKRVDKMDNRKMTGNVNIYICSEATENVAKKPKKKEMEECSSSVTETNESVSTSSTSTNKLIDALLKKRNRKNSKIQGEIQEEDEETQATCLCDGGDASDFFSEEKKSDATLCLCQTLSAEDSLEDGKSLSTSRFGCYCQSSVEGNQFPSDAFSVLTPRSRFTASDNGPEEVVKEATCPSYFQRYDSRLDEQKLPTFVPYDSSEDNYMNRDSENAFFENFRKYPYVHPEEKTKTRCVNRGRRNEVKRSLEPGSYCVNAPPSQISLKKPPESICRCFKKRDSSTISRLCQGRVEAEEVDEEKRNEEMDIKPCFNNECNLEEVKEECCMDNQQTTSKPVSVKIVDLKESQEKSEEDPKKSEDVKDEEKSSSVKINAEEKIKESEEDPKKSEDVKDEEKSSSVKINPEEKGKKSPKGNSKVFSISAKEKKEGDISPSKRKNERDSSGTNEEKNVKTDLQIEKEDTPKDTAEGKEDSKEKRGSFLQRSFRRASELMTKTKSIFSDPAEIPEKKKRGCSPTCSALKRATQDSTPPKTENTLKNTSEETSGKMSKGEDKSESSNDSNKKEEIISSAVQRSVSSFNQERRSRSKLAAIIARKKASAQSTQKSSNEDIEKMTPSQRNINENQKETSEEVEKKDLEELQGEDTPEEGVKNSSETPEKSKELEINCKCISAEIPSICINAKIVQPECITQDKRKREEEPDCDCNSRCNDQINYPNKISTTCRAHGDVEESCCRPCCNPNIDSTSCILPSQVKKQEMQRRNETCIQEKVHPLQRCPAKCERELIDKPRNNFLEEQTCRHCCNPHSRCTCRAPVSRCSCCRMPVDICDCLRNKVSNDTERSSPGNLKKFPAIRVTAWKPREEVSKYFARDLKNIQEDDEDGAEECRCFDKSRFRDEVKPRGAEELSYQSLNVFSEVLNELQQKISSSVCCTCRRRPCCCDEEVGQKTRLSPRGRSLGFQQKRAGDKSPQGPCQCNSSPRSSERRRISSLTPLEKCNTCESSPCRCRRMPSKDEPRTTCCFCKASPCRCPKRKGTGEKIVPCPYIQEEYAEIKDRPKTRRGPIYCVRQRVGPIF
ncbi:titin homolog [Orussus abietinus]|uniref:titin homolog n=1 Tax=Orussus abietinus TaxID=222816 RepID=UPI0006267570|nr:titin homolog [Orussus abietinus]